MSVLSIYLFVSLFGATGNDLTRKNQSLKTGLHGLQTKLNDSESERKSMVELLSLPPHQLSEAQITSVLIAPYERLAHTLDVNNHSHHHHQHRHGHHGGSHGSTHQSNHRHHGHHIADSSSSSDDSDSDPSLEVPDISNFYENNPALNSSESSQPQKNEKSLDRDRNLIIFLTKENQRIKKLNKSNKKNAKITITNLKMNLTTLQENYDKLIHTHQVAPNS